jgi:hypothetical protein
VFPVVVQDYEFGRNIPEEFCKVFGKHRSPITPSPMQIRGGAAAKCRDGHSAPPLIPEKEMTALLEILNETGPFDCAMDAWAVACGRERPVGGAILPEKHNACVMVYALPGRAVLPAACPRA